MSSVNSPSPPTDAGDALRRAFVEVCENSFFAYVEPCSPERFIELVDQCCAARAAEEGERSRQSEWLKASVGFSGSFEGAIEVVLPERLGIILISAMLGEELDSTLPEHWMFDGLGEFANMVCGAWLTNLSNNDAFELRPPAVTRMAKNWTPLADTSDDDRSHRLTVNDLPVRLRFRAAGD